MRVDRDQARREFGQTFHRVAAILFEEDPMGIDLGENLREYEPEAATILPRLRECGTADEAHAVVYEELDRWFGPDIGDRQRYRRTSERIWQAWLDTGEVRAASA